MLSKEDHPIERTKDIASPQEIMEGQTFAILGYALSLTLLPFFFVPLLQRKNSFSLYHAKQTLLLWIFGILSLYLGSLLLVICVGFVFLFMALVFLATLDIVGLIHAIKGEQTPLPLVGQWAEIWFKGIRKT